MKKITLFVATATLCLSLSGCAGLGALSAVGGSSAESSLVGNLASSAANGNTLGNILTSFITGNSVNANDIIGTWKYNQPGCAFTSESTLAAAGGEVIATSVKEQLATYYKKVGFKASNTTFTFNSDKTFTCTLLGKSVGGTYTLDTKTSAITLSINVMGVPAYSLSGFVKRNADGIGLLFESKKVLTILQTVGALSNNSTVSSITSLTSNYDGVRIGFDLVK